MKKGERAVSCFGKGLFDTRCPRFVRDAGEIIEQVVEEC